MPLINLNKCIALRSLRFCIEGCHNNVVYDTAQQWGLFSGILSSLPPQAGSDSREIICALHITANDASGAKELGLAPVCWSKLDSLISRSLGTDRLVFVAELAKYNHSSRDEQCEELAEGFQKLISSKLPRCAISGNLAFRC